MQGNGRVSNIFDTFHPSHDSCTVAAPLGGRQPLCIKLLGGLVCGLAARCFDLKSISTAWRYLVSRPPWWAWGRRERRGEEGWTKPQLKHTGSVGRSVGNSTSGWAGGPPWSARHHKTLHNNAITRLTCAYVSTKSRGSTLAVGGQDVEARRRTVLTSLWSLHSPAPRTATPRISPLSRSSSQPCDRRSSTVCSSTWGTPMDTGNS
jgi:hypothetical protein